MCFLLIYFCIYCLSKYCYYFYYYYYYGFVYYDYYCYCYLYYNHYNLQVKPYYYFFIILISLQKKNYLMSLIPLQKNLKIVYFLTKIGVDIIILKILQDPSSPLQLIYHLNDDILQHFEVKVNILLNNEGVVEEIQLSIK